MTTGGLWLREKADRPVDQAMVLFAMEALSQAMKSEQCLANGNPERLYDY